MTKRLIMGEDAIKEIIKAIRFLNDIEDIVWFYNEIVGEGKLVCASADEDGSTWKKWRIEVE